MPSRRSNKPAHKRAIRRAKKSDAPSVTLELEITDLSASGAGVARDTEGRVIFVAFTVPGDLVRANVKATSKRYAEAELVEVLKPSAQRIQPRCPVFGRCGGCQWQHVPYELQYRTKARGLVHSLKRREIELPGPLDEIPAEQIWEYRNRVQLRGPGPGPGPGPGKGEQLGFYASGTHEIVAISRCDIARPEINAAIPEAAREGARRGPYKLELDVSESGELRWAWNMGHSALGFRQVHDGQNEKLRSWVAANVTRGRFLLDLYGGWGNLSRALAPEMAETHCVDVGAPASPLADTSIIFHREDVKAWLKRAEREGIAARARAAGGASAILDPPREGLAGDFDSIERSLRALGVVELLAVGCDADAWAQDLSRFIKRGWTFKKAAALDLFPQTPHVEGIALLRL